MKEYTQKPERISHTLKSRPKASAQASITEMVKMPGYRTFRRESVQEKHPLLEGRYAFPFIQRKVPLIRQHISDSNKQIIQRVFAAAYGAAHNVVFSPADNQKLLEVQGLINAMPDVANTNAMINLIIDNSTGSNPANTNAANGTINIHMRHWVIRKNNAAFIAGMVAHELGAHTLSDMEMTPNDQATENNLNPWNRVINAGAHAYTLHPAANRPGAQQDHINSGKVDNQIALWSPRAKAYLHTLVRLGNSIVGPAPVGGGVVPLTPVQRTKLNELLQTYLFDIARIIVEDDQAGVGVALHTSPTSAVMNWLYGLISVPVLPIPTQPTNNWINQLNFHSSGLSLFGMLASRFSGFLAAWVQTKVSGHL